MPAGARRWFARRLPFALVLVAAATSCAALASLHWFLELFSHFTPHGVAAALVLAVAFLALKARRWAGAAAVVAAANVLLIAQHFVPPKEPEADAVGTRLTILQFNVGWTNAEPQRLVDYVLAHPKRFDVVVLIEAPRAWARELERLDKDYPHAARTLDDSPWGLAVYSKVRPLENAIIEAPDGIRHSETLVQLPGQSRPARIYGFHPPPPMGATLAHGRNVKLEEIARRIRDRAGESAIVVGDFNLTPYSPYFPAFARASGLKPARSGVLARSTWPATLARLHLGIPVDHAFVARNAQVVAHEIGPHLGSDHLPVAVTLTLR